MLDEILRYPAITRENALPLNSAAKGVSQSVCYCTVSSLSALLFCFSFPKKAEQCRGMLILTHRVLSRDTDSFGSCSVFLRHINQSLMYCLGLAQSCEERLLEEQLSLPYLLSQFLSPEQDSSEIPGQSWCHTHHTRAEPSTSIGSIDLESS